MVFRFSLLPLLAAIAKDRCDSLGLADTGALMLDRPNPISGGTKTDYDGSTS
jgi:hypothetical protein